MGIPITYQHIFVIRSDSNGRIVEFASLCSRQNSLDIPLGETTFPGERIFFEPWAMPFDQVLVQKRNETTLEIGQHSTDILVDISNGRKHVPGFQPRRDSQHLCSILLPSPHHMQ